MPKKFNDEVEAAGPGDKAPLRALQAWQYLIGKAVNRQTVPYRELMELMDYPTANPLARILGYVAYYCQQHDLPPLTVIVVNNTGEPGGGFPIPDGGMTVGRARESVYAFPWFKLVPPAIEDLEEAWDACVG